MFKCYKRGVVNRRGGSDKISKTLQEGDHFLINIRGGSDKSKILQERVSSNKDRRVLETIEYFLKNLF